MPKVGMEPLRRRQLIEATIQVVAEVGLHSTTISLISQCAGLSSGIISHYFGNKQGLIEASVRHLLGELKVNCTNASAKDRLYHIISVNFASGLRAKNTTKTWLSFWAQSLHDPELARLQEVNRRRLLSNLRYSFSQVLPREQAVDSAELLAALIDGFWLRCTLSSANDAEFDHAINRCQQFVNDILGEPVSVE